MNHFDPLSFLDQEEYRTYNVAIAKSLGSVHAAIFLSELINRYRFHQKHHKEQLLQKDGKEWFYYTQETAEERTGLSVQEQRTAINILMRHKLIEKAVSGLPAKRFFWIDIDQLVAFVNFQIYFLESENQQTGKVKSTNWSDIYKNTKKEHTLEGACVDPPLPHPPDSGRASPSAEATHLARAFFSFIQDRDKAAKEPNLTEDANLLDEMNKRRPWEEIDKMIKFSQTDEFWITRATTVENFVKSQNTIFSQMQEKEKKGKEKSTAEEAEEKTSGNKQYAKEIRLKLDLDQEGDFWVDVHHVQIKIAKTNSFSTIPYSENGFRDQLMSVLDKSGLRWKRGKNTRIS